MKKILVEIEGRNINFLLENEGRIENSFLLVENRDLTEKLLPTLDSFLKKNKITFEDISRIEIKKAKNNSVTTERIVSVIAKIANQKKKWDKTAI